MTIVSLGVIIMVKTNCQDPRLMSQVRELDQVTRWEATDSAFCPLLSFPTVAILIMMAHPTCWNKPPPGAVRPRPADVLVLQLIGHLMETRFFRQVEMNS